MNALVWHAAALILAAATVALILILGHLTLRSFGLAMGAGTAVVVGMLAIGSSGVLTERASGATTPTIVGPHQTARAAKAIRFSGTGWEVGAKRVRVVVLSPGRARQRAIDVMPNDAGEVDVTIVAPFAHRPGCTVTAVQLTILGALRASSPCTGGGLARPE